MVPDEQKQTSPQALGRAVLVLIAAVLATAASPAQASARVAVHVEGPGWVAVRQEITKLIREPFELIPREEFGEALAAARRKRLKAPMAVRRASRTSRAQVLVLGKVLGRSKKVHLRVLDMSTGEVELSKVVKRGRPVRAALAPVLRKLRPEPDVEEEYVPEEPAEQPEAEPPAAVAAADSEAPSADSLLGRRASKSKPTLVADASSARGTLIDTPSAKPAGVDTVSSKGVLAQPSSPLSLPKRINARIEPIYEIGGRSLSYVNYTQKGAGVMLLPYRIANVSRIGARVEAYPLTGTLAPFGVSASYRRALSVTSSPWNDTSTELGTQFDDFDFEVRAKLPLGQLLFTPALGYVRQRFLIEAPAGSPLAAGAPVMDYQFIRTGVDAQHPVGFVTLLAGVGGRFLLSPGPFGDQFASGSTLAFDVSAGASARLGQHIELKLTGHYQRVGFELSARANAPYSVSGAVDEFYSLRLAVIPLLF